MRKKEFVDRLYQNIHGIRVEDDVYVDTTRSADPTDEWDRDDTHTSHNIQGFSAAPEEANKYSDLWVPYEPEFDTDYYLLYVVHSTGDSFGHDSGSDIEYIGFYTRNELDIAKENERKIEAHERSQTDEGYSVELKTPDGKTFTQNTPWIGYFESLDYINIEKVRRLK